MISQCPRQTDGGREQFPPDVTSVKYFRNEATLWQTLCAFLKNKWGLIYGIQSWQVKQHMSAYSFTILETSITFSTNRYPSQHTHTLQVSDVDPWRTWRPSVCPISSHSSWNVFSFISAFLPLNKLPLFCPISLHATIWLPIFLTSCFHPPPPDVCIKSPDFSAHSLTVNRKWLTWISILLYEAELLSSLQLCCWKPSCW